MSENLEKRDLQTHLEILKMQSEMFSQLISGVADSMVSSHVQSTQPAQQAQPAQSNKKVGKLKNSRNKRSKLTEDEEDKILVETAQVSKSVVWLEKQPSILVGGTLRPYQLEGLNWMVRLYDTNINGILADEMGLGKTIQTISLLSYLREFRGINGPHLIITPKSTISNWVNEFSKWCPEFRVIRILGSKYERSEVIKSTILPGLFDVALCSNETCLIESSTLKKINWVYIIIDEAHRIKNEEAQLSKLVRILKTEHKLLMTGTPLQNNLHELWALLNFLLPEQFGDSEVFDASFNTSDSVGTENVIKQLHTILKPCMLRRVKNDVEKSLPPKKETKVFIGLTSIQKKLYTDILCRDIETINSNAFSSNKVKLLNVLMQLRKVCNHPYLFDGVEDGPPYEDGPHLWESCGKMIVLNKLLPKLKEQGSRVLIFSQMTRMIDILEDYMKLKEYAYCRIDGQTSIEDRDLEMAAFNQPGSQFFCFLLSTRAGGLGINLQTADTVILYDSDFNPQVDLQAMDRAHRIGQKKQVRVFRLVTERSVEEKMVERADRKLFLDAAVIQQGRFLEKTNQVTKGEMLSMVRFGADEIMASKDGLFTDEDIDILLKRSEERTEADLSKIKTEIQHTLATFTLKFDEIEMLNLFNFEGEDYRGKTKGESASEPVFVSLPERDSRRRVDIARYLDSDKSTIKDSDLTIKGLKKWSAPEYQFFDSKFFTALVERENDLVIQKHHAIAVMKDLKYRAKKALDSIKEQQKSDELKSQLDNVENSGEEIDEDEGSSDDDDEDYMPTENKKSALEPSYKDVVIPDPQVLLEQARSIQEDIDAGKYDLSFDNKREKELKKSEGFGDVNKNDFKIFVDTLAVFGSSEKCEVVAAVAKKTQKSAEMFARYYDVFFQKMKNLSEYTKIKEKIDAADRKKQNSKNLQNCMLEIVSSCRGDPWHEIDLSAIYSGSRDPHFLEEHDRFLVISLYKHGYGHWDAIQEDIVNAPQFMFDWFIRSRSTSDVHWRVDEIMKMVELWMSKQRSGTKGRSLIRNSADVINIPSKKQKQLVDDDSESDNMDNNLKPRFGDSMNVGWRFDDSEAEAGLRPLSGPCPHQRR